MIYKFITDKELDLGMKKYWRDQITNGDVNKHIMMTCESAAFSMIKTKLGNRYDLAKLFPQIREWSATTAFVVGDYCSRYDKIWKAKQAGTNHAPAEDAYWTAEDPRDALLVKYAAAITIYFMMESIPPRQINEEAVNQYASVMEWLDDVRDGHESPDFPLLDAGGSNNIPWGSNAPRDHYY